MIPIQKGPEPPALSVLRARYLPRIQEALSQGNLRRARANARYYNHPEVKAAVIRDSRDKCMYCEARFRGVYVGDIEHILPKAHFPQLAYTWENLGFSCWSCNNTKKSRFDATSPIANAFSEDPAQFIEPLGIDILSRNGHPRGATTIQLPGLQRVGLWDDRKEFLRDLAVAVRAWRTQIGADKVETLAYLRERTAPAAQYSAVARAYLVACGVPV